VPLLQSNENFSSAIENNFFATYDLCSIASKNNVKSFVLISSDKAVNPANLMGATKRLAELSLQAFQDIEGNKTVFSMVRFGNVLNSSGSVVPLFWEQISRGGPVTVTHEDINRFFMTIKEAASLVLQSGAMAKVEKYFY
jgi:FlaA1/EpsC-like NDP-sugar epimerase